MQDKEVKRPSQSNKSRMSGSEGDSQQKSVIKTKNKRY